MASELVIDLPQTLLETEGAFEEMHLNTDLHRNLSGAFTDLCGARLDCVGSCGRRGGVWVVCGGLSLPVRSCSPL